MQFVMDQYKDRPGHVCGWLHFEFHHYPILNSALPILNFRHTILKSHPENQAIPKA